MEFSTFIAIYLSFFVTLWFFAMISGDLATNTKWDRISVVSSHLVIILIVVGLCIAFAVSTKSATSPDNEVLCTYQIQDPDTLKLSSANIKTTTISLIDGQNDTITISPWFDGAEYIVDNKYPLVEKIRVKKLFIYRDVYLIHL